MAKTYFKNNLLATVYHEPTSGLYLVNQVPEVLDYQPAKHRAIAEALKSGRILTATEAEYKEHHPEGETSPAPKKKAKKVEEAEEETEDEGEAEDEEGEKESPLESLSTKEELMVWAEEQSFISEADLNEAKKIKKKADLKTYLQELLDLEAAN